MFRPFAGFFFLFCSLCAQAQKGTGTRPYHHGIGLRYDWTSTSNTGWTGFAYKQFLGPRVAVEAQLLFGSKAVVPDAALEYHVAIRAVPGLYGVGSVGFSVPLYHDAADLLLRPGLGAGYKIPWAPLDFGFDWRPSYRVSNGGTDDRFIGGRFSIPLRYTF